MDAFTGPAAAASVLASANKLTHDGEIGYAPKERLKQFLRQFLNTYIAGPGGHRPVRVHKP